MPGTAFSHSIWRVKPGLEQEFVRRWHEWAEWSALHGLAGPASLLHDVDEPTRFVSFGPWQSIETIRRWRGAPGFAERVERLEEVIEGVEPSTLERVSTT